MYYICARYRTSYIALWIQLLCAKCFFVSMNRFKEKTLSKPAQKTHLIYWVIIFSTVTFAILTCNNWQQWRKMERRNIWFFIRSCFFVCVQSWSKPQYSIDLSADLNAQFRNGWTNEYVSIAAQWHRIWVWMFVCAWNGRKI